MESRENQKQVSHRPWKSRARCHFGWARKFRKFASLVKKAIQKFKDNNCGDPPSGVADWATKPLPDDVQQRYDDYKNPKPATFGQLLSHGPMMYLGW